MTMQASEQTLDFYGNMLDLQENDLRWVCEPETLIDEEEGAMRVQALKSGNFAHHDGIPTSVDICLNQMAKIVLQQTLRNDGEQGLTRVGTTFGVQIGHTLPRLLFNPKIVTGSVTSLSIQPVSPDELSKVGSLPKSLAARRRTPVRDMDTFFLISGEVKISRSVGYIACGIRLSEFDSPMGKHLKYRRAEGLDENGMLFDKVSLGVINPEHVYTFGTTSRRGIDTAASPLGALSASIHNARGVEAANRARPFGGMRE